MIIVTNKKGEGPGVGSAQHRSRSLDRGGTVTSSKAGIHIQLPCGCAVLRVRGLPAAAAR